MYFKLAFETRSRYVQSYRTLCCRARPTLAPCKCDDGRISRLAAVLGAPYHLFTPSLRAKASFPSCFQKIVQHIKTRRTVDATAESLLQSCLRKTQVSANLGNQPTASAHRSRGAAPARTRGGCGRSLRILPHNFAAREAIGWLHVMRPGSLRLASSSATYLCEIEHGLRGTGDEAARIDSGPSSRLEPARAPAAKRQSSPCGAEVRSSPCSVPRYRLRHLLTSPRPPDPSDDSLSGRAGRGP